MQASDGHVHTGDTCDCLKSSHILRIQGDKAFRVKNFTGAIELYSQALEGEGGKPDKLIHANRYVLYIECPHSSRAHTTDQILHVD